jgi:protein SCO1
VVKLSQDIVLLSLEKDPHKKSFFAGKLELIAIVFVIAGIGLVLLMSILNKEKKSYGTRPSKE